VGIKAADDGTLEVTLAAPANFFPAVLCHHSFAPVHASMLALEDWSAQPPLSNGPYYLTERNDERLELTKNAFYWDADRVAVPRLIVRFEDDGAAAARLWNTGNAQWLAGVVELEALADNGSVSVNAMFATHYYYVRSSLKPWNDRRVRRALSIVLPWDEIREGHMLPASTLIYPIPGYPELQGIKQGDFADEARKLLAEACFEGGKGTGELVLRITPSEDSLRIAEIMKRVWEKELGISVRLDTVPFESYYASLKGDDYAVGSTTWIGDFADPYTFLQMWLADSKLNDARYNDPEFEAIVGQSMTQEGKERWSTLAEAEKLLLEGGTVLPISFTPALNVIDTGEIEGWYPNPLDIHPFKYLRYAAFRPLPGVALLRP
jgi:peptide/nickel transport system substrate-binding protein/oligopeptide transport system substrate-binding protein